MKRPGLTESRPIRALVVVLGSWAAVRTVMLWPQTAPPTEHRRDDRVARPSTRAAPVTVTVNGSAIAPRSSSVDVPTSHQRISPVTGRDALRAARRYVLIAQAPGAADGVIAGQSQHDDNPASGAPIPLAEPAKTVVHWHLSGSAWVLVRDGRYTPSLVPAGQLGASQAGLRLFVARRATGLAITTRASAPLERSRGREATIGLALRGRAVGIIVEQRLALDPGGRTAPSANVYGGLYDIPVSGGFRADGYAQAGVVGVRDVAGFADGALSVSRTLARRGRARLDAGVMIGGGAQPNLARLDIGPQLVARLSLGETTARLTAEWRHRIAGRAAPDSGPAMTIGLDF